MKTLTLAEIHADPHCLDAIIRAGEPVEFLHEGRAIAQLTPAPKPPAKAIGEPRPFSGAEAAARLRARTDAIWGNEKLTDEEADAIWQRMRADRRFLDVKE